MTDRGCKSTEETLLYLGTRLQKNKVTNLTCSGYNRFTADTKMCSA